MKRLLYLLASHADLPCIAHELYVKSRSMHPFLNWNPAIDNYRIRGRIMGFRPSGTLKV